MKKKSFILDMGLNIVATAIPIVALQLFILPALSKDMPDGDDYGLLLTMVSLFSIVPASMGNSLNNIRLLYNDEYAEKKQVGDFNLLLLIFAAINCVVMVVCCIWLEGRISVGSILWALLLSLLWLAKEYYVVAFRLKIDYVAIIINNLLQVGGYVVGYLIYQMVGHWQLIYALGYAVSLVHIFAKCSLWHEKPIKTKMFKNTTWQSTLLLFSGFLNSVISYADKLFIFPMLGGAAVSVYYASTVFGKIVAMGITPINNVALTYLAKMRKKADNMFRMAMLLGGAVCVIGYIGCIIISRPLLTALYPQFVDLAMEYIFITTATTIVSVMIGIANPFILKYFDMKWQIVLNAGTVLVYVVACMSLLSFFGLFGFCVGTLIANIFKFLLMLFIYQKCKQRPL